MNDLEGRLKEAYVAATDTVSPDNLRRLDEQFVLITWPEPRRQRPVRRWLIPLTSVAVLAIIAATALPAFLTSSGGGRATSAQGERFVGALTPDSRQFVIVNAATGMKVASVTPPTQHEIFSNAATGDGVTYVTAVTRPGVCGARLYKFSLDSAGKPGRLTPFDGGHLLQDVSQLALSADGHSFADLVYVCPAAKKANASLYFVNFKTGQKRRWTIYSFSTISELSLSRDGGLLVLGGGPINGLRSGIVLVNTSGRSGPINARSADLVTLGRIRPSPWVLGCPSDHHPERTYSLLRHHRSRSDECVRADQGRRRQHQESQARSPCDWLDRPGHRPVGSPGDRDPSGRTFLNQNIHDQSRDRADHLPEAFVLHPERRPLHLVNAAGSAGVLVIWKTNPARGTAESPGHDQPAAWWSRWSWRPLWRS